MADRRGTLDRYDGGDDAALAREVSADPFTGLIDSTETLTDAVCARIVGGEQAYAGNAHRNTVPVPPRPDHGADRTLTLPPDRRIRAVRGPPLGPLTTRAHSRETAVVVAKPALRRPQLRFRGNGCRALPSDARAPR